jgi:nicotinic acid phosphoribosyltransferase
MMRKINNALIEQGFPPYAWGLYGVGGGLRNSLKRDNLSAKYALCGVGDRPVVKFSETLGKTTLPGPFKVLRSFEALHNNCKTVAFEDECPSVPDAMVEHFDGTRLGKPFGPGMDDDFLQVKERIKRQFVAKTMPLTLETPDNHNYPATDAVRRKRLELLAKYAPKKRKENY